MRIAGKEISKVAVVDDDRRVRESTAEIIADMNLKPTKITSVGPLSDFVSRMVSEFHAVVCDHRLKSHGYASFQGARAFPRLYRSYVPSVLCTAFSDAEPDEFRRYRRYIPALVTSAADTDAIVRGWEACIREFRNEYSPQREPVQTLVRIAAVDMGSKQRIAFAIVPGWDTRQVVRFPVDIVRLSLRRFLRPDARFFAKVNIGAETPGDLYLSDFEYRG
ncbi:MAG TPA: hypothetical protein VMH22_12475 [bacterium]|nr:hypothetical protein [bacterium]